MNILTKYIKFLYALFVLVLPACDLGNFDPVNSFEQEPLEADAVAIETANDCGFALLVNNDRLQQSSSGAEIKGSLYASINSNEVYLGSGEFEVATDAEGRVTAFSGLANTQLYQVSYLEPSILEKEFFANLSLNSSGLPSVFESDVLPTDGCYLHYITSEDTVAINSGNGILKVSEAYVNPNSEFMLYRGALNLSAISTQAQWMAIDANSSFSFEAENGSEGFESFDGNIYTESEMPLLVDSIQLNVVGNTFLDGSYENGGLNNFFNASSANVQIGNNGTTTVSYVFADKILGGYNFYLNSDKSDRSNSFTLTPSAFYFRRNDGIERFSFNGDVADVPTLINGLLRGHNAIRVLEFPSGTSALVEGNYTEAESSRYLNIKTATALNLASKGTYELRDAEFNLTKDALTLGGIFVSSFNTLPDIFVSGNLQDDGSMILAGQSLFAVNFDGTTLPVTFSINIEVTEGEEILQVSGLAEYCDGGNCIFIPVTSTIDFENEILQLCVDIPNRGVICIE